MTDHADDFAEMALTLHDEPTTAETVDRVVEFALKAVDCAHAGVLFVHRKHGVESVAVSSSLVGRLDALQYELGEGPDIEVAPGHASRVIHDTRTETRWPRWAVEADRAGIRSMLSTCLYTSETTLGSLNLYDGEPHHFSESDLQVAHVLARHAAVAIQSIKDTENLWRAIDARKLIGQAQGILMERHGVDGDQAFSVLRRYSQDNNVKLHDVARHLVEHRRLLN